MQNYRFQLYGWVTDNSRKVIDLRELQCVWNTTHKPGECSLFIYSWFS